MLCFFCGTQTDWGIRYSTIMIMMMMMIIIIFIIIIIILRMRQRPTLLDETGLKLVSGDSQFLLHPFADHDAHADDDAVSIMLTMMLLIILMTLLRKMLMMYL